MNLSRDPRVDPIPGDLIRFKFGEHLVLEVNNGIVYYLDERLRDYVPIERWRRWYEGKGDCSVVKRGDS